MGKPTMPTFNDSMAALFGGISILMLARASRGEVVDTVFAPILFGLFVLMLIRAIRRD